MNVNKEQKLLNIKTYKLAVESIEEGKDIQDKIYDNYGNGMSANQMHFGRTLGYNCASVASRLVEQNTSSLQDITGKLFQSVKTLNECEIAYTFDQFKTFLIKRVSVLVDENGKLRQDVEQKMTEALQIRQIKAQKNK